MRSFLGISPRGGPQLLKGVDSASPAYPLNCLRQIIKGKAKQSSTQPWKAAATPSEGLQAIWTAAPYSKRIPIIVPWKSRTHVIREARPSLLVQVLRWNKIQSNHLHVQEAARMFQCCIRYDEINSSGQKKKSYYSVRPQILRIIIYIYIKNKNLKRLFAQVYKTLKQNGFNFTSII